MQQELGNDPGIGGIMAMVSGFLVTVPDEELRPQLIKLRKALDDLLYR